jgi:adenosine kinase
MSGSDLENAVKGSWMLIGNDYEIELVKQRMDCGEETLLGHSQMVVTTLGRLGSRIAGRDGTVEIPAAPARAEVDPTGAGDAYRAGLIAGLLRGMDIEVAGRVASLAATYAIEQVGTAEHSYGRDEFSERYRKSFGSPLPVEFFS